MIRRLFALAIAAAVMFSLAPAPARAEVYYDIIVRNQDLYEFCSTLGNITRHNFVPVQPDTPHTPVTMRLMHVTLDDLLAHLYNDFDLEIVEAGNGYIVGPSTIMNRRYPNNRGGRFSPHTRIITLANIKAIDVKGYLDSSLPSGTVVTADPRGVAVQVTGAAPVVERAIEIVRQLDVRSDTSAGGIVTKSYHVEHVAALDVYGAMRLGILSNPPNSMVVAPQVNDIIATGTPEYVAQVGSVISKYDAASPQFVLEVMGIDVEPDTFVRETGLALGGVDAQGNQNAASGQTVITSKSIRFNAQLSMLERSGSAKTLLAETVLCRNNVTCEDFVGDTISVVSTNSFSGLKTIQQFNAGADLKITNPVVGASSIILPIQATFSQISAYVEGIPQISSRTITANMELQNDSTFVIGTLYNAHDFQNLQKIPGLGNLPLIGGLFRDRRVDRARTEVVFVATVHVLQPTDHVPGLLRELKDVPLPSPPPSNLVDQKVLGH